MLIPVSSLAAWMKTVDPVRHFLYESIFDFWEALVVYSFFMLILSYAGGEHIWFTSTMVTHPDGLAHPWPFSKFYPPMALDAKFMRNCKRACLQFVLCKPLMVFIGLIQQLFHVYDSSFSVAFRNIVYNITYTVALYALGLLYMTMHHHPGLVGKKPIAKFLTVKTVIFFTFWQRYLILMAPHAEEMNLEEVVICIEMLLFSLPINFVAFSWKEFRTPSLPKGVVAKMTRVFNNGAKALSPADLAISAALNFAHKYETHVLLEENDGIVELGEMAPKKVGKSVVLNSGQSSSTNVSLEISKETLSTPSQNPPVAIQPPTTPGSPNAFARASPSPDRSPKKFSESRPALFQAPLSQMQAGLSQIQSSRIMKGAVAAAKDAASVAKGAAVKVAEHVKDVVKNHHKPDSPGAKVSSDQAASPPVETKTSVAEPGNSSAPTIQPSIEPVRDTVKNAD